MLIFHSALHTYSFLLLIGVSRRCPGTLLQFFLLLKKLKKSKLSYTYTHTIFNSNCKYRARFLISSPMVWIGHISNISQSNFWTGLWLILCVSLPCLCYQWPSLSGNSEVIHCGILIYFAYLWLHLADCPVPHKAAHHESVQAGCKIKSLTLTIQ